MKIIILTNVLTQILLNVITNVVIYRAGYSAYVLSYLLIELVILLIEAKIYKKYLGKVQKGKKRWAHLPELYAFCANASSFLLGVCMGNSLLMEKFFY